MRGRSLVLATSVSAAVLCVSPAVAASLYTISVFENGFNVGPITGEQTTTSGTPISGTMTAGPLGGSIVATAASSQGHVGASLQESESLGGEGFAVATFSTDVHITGPAAGQIPIALNLGIAGVLNATNSADTGWAAIAEIAHTDFSFSTSIDTLSSPRLAPLGLVFTSGGQVFAGGSSVSDTVSGVLTTGFVNIDPSLPVHIAITLQLNGFGNPGTVDDGFLSSLDFVRGMDVFTLPAGYTANDPDAFLINNRFSPTTVTPLPSALPLFLSGLALIGGLSRRKKRERHAIADRSRE